MNWWNNIKMESFAFIKNDYVKVDLLTHKDTDEGKITKYITKLGFTWAQFCKRIVICIHPQGNPRKLHNKIFALVAAGWKDDRVLYIFLHLLKFILLDVDFYQHKNIGYKNSINEDNLGGSQLCAMCRRLHLKIQLPSDSSRVWMLSGRFLPLCWDAHWICFLLVGWLNSQPPSPPASVTCHLSSFWPVGDSQRH